MKPFIFLIVCFLILCGSVAFVLTYNVESEHWFMDKRFAYKEDKHLIYIVDTNTNKQYLATKYGGMMEIE